MPAFLDMIADSGMIRGMLPLLNRSGQSLAPLLLSDRLSSTPLKTRWLMRSTISMGLPFLFLAASIHVSHGQLPPWFSLVYLATYAAFFCLHGINETCYSIVQGKLIPVEFRGRLSGFSSTTGSLIAVTLAWWLLGRWLPQGGQASFARIFLFVGSGMMLSSIAILALNEPSDQTGPRLADVRRRHFREALHRIRQDSTLRGLCLIAALFVFSQLLFPHYQRLGMELPDAQPVLLMQWVVAQHLGAALFSTISGRMADRIGTRAALRFLTAAAALAPLLALALSRLAPVHYYCLAFFWIGLVPVTFRMQVNYALEIVPRSQHPAYISTMTLCMAVPFLLSPLLGGLVQWLGFTLPFLLVSAIVSLAAWKTWSMPEPRHPSFQTAWLPAADEAPST
jgi:predicted MFS family arabinose efflux permease